MKNIAIMSWSLNQGGAERAAANLSKDLSDRYNVYLIVFDSRNITYPYSGELVDLGLLPAKGILGKALTLVKRCRKLRAIKKEKNIVASISFMQMVNYYNLFSNVGERDIISIRNNMSQKGASLLNRILMKQAGKKAYMTVSLSDGVRKDLISNFGYSNDKVVTIYNSCNPDWFLRDSKEVEALINSYDFSKPSIVTVGRLTHQKGQWHLISAFKEVKKTIADCQLVIFGQGELEQSLQQYADKLGILEDVHFFGYVPNHHQFMAKCDVFVFPSLYEGLGNVLLEALACNMPVISTDCESGPSEILNDSLNLNSDSVIYGKYGILTPAFNNDNFDPAKYESTEKDFKLAEAIINVLLNEDMCKKYKDAARLRIADFLPSTIQGKWADLIVK